MEFGDTAIRKKGFRKEAFFVGVFGGGEGRVWGWMKASWLSRNVFAGHFMVLVLFPHSSRRREDGKHQGRAFAYLTNVRSRVPAKTVEALLAEIKDRNEAFAALVQSVRTLVKKSIPTVTEEVKYGGILFSSTVPFCGVFAYKEHVSVEFSKGTLIDDTLGHLEGDGKGRRHIKLFAAKDVKAKALTRYVPLAWEAARSVG